MVIMRLAVKLYITGLCPLLVLNEVNATLLQATVPSCQNQLFIRNLKLSESGWPRTLPRLLRTLFKLYSCIHRIMQPRIHHHILNCSIICSGLVQLTNKFRFFYDVEDRCSNGLWRHWLNVCPGPLWFRRTLGMLCKELAHLF